MSGLPRLDDFSAALAYLASFTDFEQKNPEVLARRVLNLDRMNQAVAKFGHPEHTFRSVHVTGTKGKGTTTHLIDEFLRIHGLASGRFISPHLVDLRERVAVNGQEISPEDFLNCVREIRPWIEDLRSSKPELLPSFFEVMTLIAFLWFRRQNVQWAAVEVGLGGRLDATNVLQADVAVLTSIDLEHTRVLGSTIEAICEEKAGIIKSGSRVVSGLYLESSPGRIIEKAAATRGAQVSFRGRDFEIVDVSAPSFGRLRFNYRGRRVFTGLEMPGYAHHQIDNAALAIEVMALLEEHHGVPISEEGLRYVLDHFTPAARLQFQPSRSGGTWPFDILLDTAHTRSSMASLAAVCRDSFPRTEPTLLLALLRDKDPAYILPPLRRVFRQIVVTTVPSPRALAAEELLEAVRRVLPETPASLAPTDLRQLKTQFLVVAGSTYLAREFLVTRPELKG